MTKKQIVRLASQKTLYSQELIEKVLDAALEAMENALVKNETITLYNFGTLQPRDRKGHSAFSGVAGREIFYPGKTYVKFTASKALLHKLNPDDI